MFVFSEEKAQIRQKILDLSDDLKKMLVRCQELNTLAHPYNAVPRSLYLNINHAIIRAMATGYSQTDAQNIVQSDLELSDETMAWAKSYKNRIHKGYVTYAEIYAAKRMKAKNFSTRQIADVLGISPSTVLERLKQEQNL